MNPYDECCITEKEGVSVVLRWLKKKAKVRHVVCTFKGCMSARLQKEAGDLLLNHPHTGELLAVELKTEKENLWGNLFLETWSNRSRRTPGWMYHLADCDLLLYYFQESMELYSVSFPALREWAFSDNRLLKFRETKQKKREQPNDTWGRCVPIALLQAELGMKRFDLSENT